MHFATGHYLSDGVVVRSELMVSIGHALITKIEAIVHTGYAWREY
ncbi:hypothetical protein QWZ16_07405 [Vibrio ostreicida]|uniref:Uncharacterized protein n=1 Tax=Vibrio ostreicida TaxID=526588 RepID=A0ABT8BRE9_9VIBR|nr:hypothetical protein [Vibrio ostreicida]MDN3609528.1 hypothetical protein [Vibrio ostreicida]